MGPFVPYPITDQMNLVVALVLGTFFGFVLEQAGFSSSRRLVGVFYGYDMTVLRVFFTAAVTAMAGVLLLGSAGLLDTSAIFVNPTWLLPALVGGAFMGVGFLLGGYCPGTSVCAAAIGKVDALAFVGGGALGVLAYGEAYPWVEPFADATALGPIRVFDSLGISSGLFALLLVLVSVVAFAGATWVERRVDPQSAPSLSFPARRHAAAAVVLVGIGIVLFVLPDYRSRLLARAVERGRDGKAATRVMSVDELAFRIVDREPRLLVVDVRGPAGATTLSLPGALHVAVDDLFSREWRAALGPRHVRKVVVGASEEQERTAAALLDELGYENLAILEGGFGGFERTILAGAPYVPSGQRWDADVARFRASARPAILQILAEGRAVKKAEPKKEKKVQGGC